MNQYKYSNIPPVPRPSTVFGISAAWLAFIAVAAVSSLGASTSSGDLAIRLTIALGSAAVAIVAAVAAFRLNRSCETEDNWLGPALKAWASSEEAGRESRSRAA